jgi:hypothetical protein
VRVIGINGSPSHTKKMPTIAFLAPMIHLSLVSLGASCSALVFFLTDDEGDL